MRACCGVKVADPVRVAGAVSLVEGPLGPVQRRRAGPLILWGSQTGLGLCGLRVFIDQAVEDRSALDLHGGLAWCWSGRVGRLLGQGAVGTMIVIVPRVFGQDGGQMSSAEDEHPVGALASDGAHPALGLGVRPGAPAAECEGYPARRR